MKEKKKIDQTQILNFQEVKEKSSIEKKERKSKVFPILLTMIGLFLIGCGIFLMSTQDIMTEDTDKNDIKNDEVIQNTFSCEYKEQIDDVTKTVRFDFNYQNQTNSTIEKYKKVEMIPLNDEIRLNDIYQTNVTIDGLISPIEGITRQTVLENHQVTITTEVTLSYFTEPTLQYTFNETAQTMTLDYHKTNTKADIEQTIKAKNGTCK